MSDVRVKGSIIKALSGFYYVKTENNIVTTRARGKFRYQKITPLVGDWVEVILQDDTVGALDHILDRKNTFERPAVANIDQMVIVASGSIPVTDPFLIDQMIAIAEAQNCEPIICINKWDIKEADELFKIYSEAGFHTLKTSAVTGEGIEKLREVLKGKISVFTGNSGVGKSSVLNALDDSHQIPVAEVSNKLGRGKHTTRHIELYELRNGGLIGDTPGFSAFDMDMFKSKPLSELQDCFREFLPYINECFYVGCSHTKEKNCAVLLAVQDGEISKSRHTSYVRLYQQESKRKHWK